MAAITLGEWLGGVVILGGLAWLVGYLLYRVSRRLRAQSGPEAGLVPWIVAGLMASVFLFSIMRELVGPLLALASWLLLVGGALAVTRAQSRNLASREPEPVEPRTQLPSEYRYQPGPPGLYAAAMLVPFGLLLFGSLLLKRSTGAAITLAAFIASVAGGTTLLLIWRRQRQLSIIRSVEARAASLESAELRALVARLELEHSKLEMRRLRRLPEVRERT